EMRARGILKEVEFALDAWPSGPQIRLIHYDDVVIIQPIYASTQTGRNCFTPVYSGVPLLFLEGDFTEHVRRSEDPYFIPIKHREVPFEAQRRMVEILMEAPPNRIFSQVCVPEEEIKQPQQEIDWAETTGKPDYLMTYEAIDKHLIQELTGYLARLRFLYEGSTVSILDVGCGRGRLIKKIHESLVSLGIKLNLVGLEPNEELAKMCAREGLNVERGNAQNMSFRSNSFQVVISSGATNVGVVSPDTGMRIKDEIYRVTSQQGLVLFTGKTPIIPAPGKYYDPPIPELEERYEIQRLSHMEVRDGELYCRQLHSLVKK
ncbi:MAG: class I SAM-dependent methyltransferase, partial [Candidatus Saganbacteria bacterium]|nr:class I SAM-dependent methyltransferase [Candidatus Saganbacteria bacterium]